MLCQSRNIVLRLPFRWSQDFCTLQDTRRSAGNGCGRLRFNKWRSVLFWWRRGYSRHRGSAVLAKDRFDLDEFSTKRTLAKFFAHLKGHRQLASLFVIPVNCTPVRCFSLEKPLIFVRPGSSSPKRYKGSLPWLNRLLWTPCPAVVCLSADRI
jgi:hypothetical protein